jgi:hypothetical protein
MSEINPKWPLKSSVYAFESYLQGHTRVAKIETIEEHVYTIYRIDLPNLIVIHSNIYIFSEADLYEMMAGFKNVNAIVLAGFWNSYSKDAKQTGIENNIALFNFKEFFGALNYEGQKFLEYVLPANRTSGKP